MLIPTTMQRLPSDVGCFNGQLLFGGSVSMMASALAQLTRVKNLGEAHYYVGRSVVSFRGGRTRIIATGDLKSTTSQSFLYQSTPISSHLAIVVQYAAANFEPTVPVSITLKLRDTSSNSYTGTVLDLGCKFTEIDLTAGFNTALEVFTGTELINAPSNVVSDPPRPLYVPTANRGELLNIEVITDFSVILGLHIYDLLIPEVTP